MLCRVPWPWEAYFCERTLLSVDAGGEGLAVRWACAELQWLSTALKQEGAPEPAASAVK